MKILVVDDDGLAAEMTGAILEALGHEIVISENGIDALERLGSDPGISLVISDLNMPFVSGIDLFNSLREQGNRTPFILLSGNDPGQALKLAPTLDACLLKDSSLEEVLPGIIARICRN
jgi:CheY-like chemotaxis protein